MKYHVSYTNDADKQRKARKRTKRNPSFGATKWHDIADIPELFCIDGTCHILEVDYNAYDKKQSHLGILTQRHISIVFQKMVQLIIDRDKIELNKYLSDLLLTNAEYLSGEITVDVFRAKIDDIHKRHDVTKYATTLIGRAIESFVSDYITVSDYTRETNLKNIRKAFGNEDLCDETFGRLVVSYLKSGEYMFDMS